MPFRFCSVLTESVATEQNRIQAKLDGRSFRLSGLASSIST